MFDLMNQLLGAYMASKGLQNGPTLQGVDSTGRIDVLVSECVAATASVNPLLALTHAALRPVIDETIVQYIGPQVIVSQLGAYLTPTAVVQVAVVGEKQLRRVAKAAGLAPKGAKGKNKGAKSKRQVGCVTEGFQSSNKVLKPKANLVTELTLQADGTYA